MHRAVLPLIVCLLAATTFAADPNQPYGVFPRPTTQPTFKVYSSGLSPFTLIHNTGPRTLLFQDLDKDGLAGPSHVAYVHDHKVRIIPTTQPIDTANMTESWMLFFFHSSKGWPQIKNTPYPIDIPVFVVLQKMPSEIKPAGSGVEFTFPAESGYIALMPFFGTSFIRASQTAAWKDTLPQDIFLRCRLLAEISREYPIKVEETFKVFPSQDKLLIRNRFDFLSIDDDWKTGHRKIAPLEYPVALANRYKFRLLSVAGQVTDFDTPVGPGLWAGVEADECSYTLTGLLRYINTVEQPKQIPPDHPLLADARKNFDWKTPAARPDSLADAWARATLLAGHLSYAEAPIQQSLRLSFGHLADLLLDPKDPPNSGPRAKLPVSSGEIFRGFHDMAAATHDLSLIAGRWPLLRDLYRSDDVRWGDAMHGNAVDSNLTAAICMARMAHWLGDDDMYRLASCHAAKQFLILWTTSTAYPKWVKERNLYACIPAFTAYLQVQEENGSILVTNTTSSPRRTMALEDLSFSVARGGNLGFCPDTLQGFHDPGNPEMRFIKDRMPEHAKHFLDAFARKYMPDFHKATYLDQSKLPANPPSLPLGTWYKSLLQPRLDDWDFYFDIPLAQRPARHEKFWQNNGGIKGHELDIILAGLDRKYVPLWQGSTPPQPDSTFRPAPLADVTTSSPVFFVYRGADLSWFGPRPPIQKPEEPAPRLRLCNIRTR